MKITKRMYNLEKGTTIEMNWGLIELTSEYNGFNDTYEYVELEPSEDGTECIVTEKTGTLCPADLLGAEII